MKAIKTKYKIALPMMLIGLLALDTSWQQFFKTGNMKSTDLASSADAIKAKAFDVCDNTGNGIKSGISSILKGGSTDSTSFSIRDVTRNDDFKETLTVDGEEIEYKYRGDVSVERITTGPLTLMDIRNNQVIADSGCDFDIPKDQVIKPVQVFTKNGTVKKQKNSLGNRSNSTKSEKIGDNGEIEEYWRGQNLPVQRFERYHVLRIRVNAQTTEADFESCTDCEEKALSESSQIKCIKVAVEPSPTSMGSVCRQTFENAIDAFQVSEKNLKLGANDHFEEILEVLNDDIEEQDLADDRDTLEEQCRIKPGMSIGQIKKYKKDRSSLPKEFSFAGKPEEKAECIGEQMDNKDSLQERRTYFKANVAPYLQKSLTSTDPVQRQIGQDLMSGVTSGSYGTLTAFEAQQINMMQRGATQLDMMSRLTAAVERSNGAPEAVMALENFKRQMDMEYYSVLNMGTPDAVSEANFWHNKIQTLQTTAQYTTPGSIGATNTLNYNLSGRGSRLASGHIPMASEFERARAQISNTPNFMNNSYYKGGTDAYERNLRQTSPPRAEMSIGSSRLVRSRN